MYSDGTVILFAGDFVPPDPQNTIYSDKLRKTLTNKDFSIVNLEAPLTMEDAKFAKNGNNLKAKPDCISHLIAGNFNAVALSNNHIKDYGGQGVMDTIRTCKDYGILFVGAGRDLEDAAKPIEVVIHSKAITILNYCEKEFNSATNNYPGANTFSLIDAYNQINTAKISSNYIIVIYHGGIEHHYLPTPEIVKRFKYLIDIGADCVVSHHTHMYSCVIEYKSKPIFFGLGNFYFPRRKVSDDGWLYGLLGKLILNNNGISAEVIPTKMSNNYSMVDVLVGEEKERVLKHTNDLSAIVKDVDKLNHYWNKAFLSETGQMMSFIKSSSRYEYKLRKHLPMLLSNMSAYRKRNLLNLIRCDSHREKLTYILEQIDK